MFRTARARKLRPTYRRHRLSRFEPLERRELLSAVPPTVTKVEVASTSWSSSFVQKLNPSPDSHGYTIPVGSAAQSATLTWDNINQITITFSKDVVIDAADLSLSGVNTPAYHFGAFHYNPQLHSATWTLTGPLDLDRVRIDLDGNGANPVRDLDGNVLDGEWTNNSSVVSGNGTAGGDFEFTFNVLPTDVNNSASINSYDYVYIRQLDGKSSSSVGYVAVRDIDGNGIINSIDWQEALNRISQVLPSGYAAGTYNDAPTTSGFGLQEINDASVDVAISLLGGFADSESGSGGLTYTIVSNSDSTLFDSVAIDNSTKSLVINATDSAVGRANIVVRATDAGGLSVDTTVTVDVKRQNQAPEIHNFTIGAAGWNLFLISGDVSDADDNISNFIVQFSGTFQTRAAVDTNGHFEFAVQIPEGVNGMEYVTTQDPHGQVSDTYWAPIYNV